MAGIGVSEYVRAMPLTDFTDEDGRVWQVWDTFPSLPSQETALHRYMGARPRDPAGNQPAPVRDAYRTGWLTFKTEHERRRLAPVPDHWAEFDLSRLRALLAQATVIRKGEE